MKITPLNSFLKFYVMRSTQVDLFGIAHVKVDFILYQKMYVMPRIGRFVWTTCFVQCDKICGDESEKTNCYSYDQSAGLIYVL